MQMDKMTIRSQEALQGAQRVAQRHAHQELDGEHLLVALLEQADSLVPDVCASWGGSSGAAGGSRFGVGATAQGARGGAGEVLCGSG
jgi:hypothetical protein